mgnify:FL=1|tara:strand:+ start:773 stop:1069 length:297 start_codon:yes stop_codon:yes gene_type:complete
MQTRFITSREQEVTEGNYVEGIVVEFAGRYFWLLENGDCTETEVSDADLNCADDYIAEGVFTAIDLADKIKLNYSVDRVAEFAEDLYTETVGIKHKNN